MQQTNHKPNKLLGQNFLRDKNVLRQIIAAANLTASDTVLEVGPGEGVLTEGLARQAGRVIAVEKDKNLVAGLKAKFANNKNVEIIEGDILKFLNEKDSNPLNPPFQGGHKITPLTQRGAGGLKNPYKVVANIPYYLTSRLIRLLLESANPPSDIILMVQKEVAQRICPPRLARSSGEAGARSPRMSLLAISVQFYADAKIIAKVPKNAFWPQPKVDSAIIRITPRSICPPSKGGVGEVKKGFIRTQNLNPPTPLCIRGDKKETHQFFKVLHAGFSHPRKQLLNNLSLGLKVPRDKIADILQSAGLKPTQRAETLSVDDWIKLTAAIFIIPLVKGD